MTSADFGNCRTFKTKWWMASFYNMCLCLIEWFVECQGKAQTVSHNCWLLSALSALQRLSKTLPAIFCPSEREGCCYNIIKVFSIRGAFLLYQFFLYFVEFSSKNVCMLSFSSPIEVGSQINYAKTKNNMLLSSPQAKGKDDNAGGGVGGECNFWDFSDYSMWNLYFQEVFSFPRSVKIVPKQRWRDRIVKSSSSGRCNVCHQYLEAKAWNKKNRQNYHDSKTADL